MRADDLDLLAEKQKREQQPIENWREFYEGSGRPTQGWNIVDGNGFRVACLGDAVDPNEVSAICALHNEALSASPTRAQAASAGEPVAWVDGADLGFLRDRGQRLTALSMTQALPCMVPLYAAPTPVAAYREVTADDVIRMLDALNHENGMLVPRWLKALTNIHAVILTPKDSTPNYDAEGAVKIPDPERP